MNMFLFYNIDTGKYFKEITIIVCTQFLSKNLIYEKLFFLTTVRNVLLILSIYKSQQVSEKFPKCISIQMVHVFLNHRCYNYNYMTNLKIKVFRLHTLPLYVAAIKIILKTKSQYTT